MIEARSVTYRSGDATLLSDVELGASAGELLVLVGPNGAGKSTLLGVLAGELVPTEGEVWLAGRPARQWSATRRAELCATHARADEDRSLLSGDESTSPRALLLDEPTANLDLARQHATLRLARRMAEDDCAVVCALHDLNLAAQYATTLAVMYGGRVHSVGPPSRILTPALLAEVFDVDAAVLDHPALACPMVVTRGPRERRVQAPLFQERSSRSALRVGLL